jgi:hypothetical protein
VQEAVRELHMMDADARRLLREQKLIHLIKGRRRVVAEELAQAIKDCPVEGGSVPARPRGRAGNRLTKSLLDLPLAELPRCK